MRSSSDLSKLNDVIQARIVRITRGFTAAANGTQDYDRLARDSILATSVIELDNVLVTGLRQFTISTLYKARTMGGARVTHAASIGNERQASAYMLSVKNIVAYQKANSPIEISRKIEPTIRDPKDTSDILAACDASNKSAFDTALAFNFLVFDTLGTVRNFYGHRNLHTWNKARNKAFALGLNPKHANDLITATLDDRPVSVFEDWANELSIFFDQAVR